MIRKLKSGEYRLYSRKLDPRTGKRRNLGTFDSREKAERHELRRTVLQTARLKGTNRRGPGTVHDAVNEKSEGPRLSRRHNRSFARTLS